MYTGLQMFDIPGSYFELPEDSIAEDESHEKMRYAERLEVLHTAYHVSLYDWEKAWQPKGPNKYPLNEHVANSMFFDPLLYTPNNRTGIALR